MPKVQSVQDPARPEHNRTATDAVSLFEFGSDEAVVREVQQRYVPFFRDAAPVLDIGCGRGIFLQLLADAGIAAAGVDQAEESISACRAKGFQVHQEEVRAFLQRNRQQFGGIFCSHVIEHFGYDDAMTLLGLCHDALRPGGVLALVTPNPEDLSIIGEIFWLDPTHVRPYPLALLRSMVQTTGFDVTHEEQFLGSWRMIGRRNLPAFLLRKLVLGRFYGRPNTLLVAKRKALPSS